MLLKPKVHILLTFLGSNKQNKHQNIILKMLIKLKRNKSVFWPQFFRTVNRFRLEFSGRDFQYFVLGVSFKTVMNLYKVALRAFTYCCATSDWNH